MAKVKKWMEDRVYAKLVNVEHPGENIYVNVQGKGTLYPDGFTGWIPRLIKHAIDDAWHWVYSKESVSLDTGQERKKVKHHRYLCIEMAPPAEKSKPEKAKDELIDKAIKSKEDNKPKKSFGQKMADLKEQKKKDQENIISKDF